MGAAASRAVPLSASLAPGPIPPIFERMSETITLTVNGAPHPLATPASVATLLAAIGLDTRKVAVELNEEIVSRSRYGETRLAEGDQLEIVHFIGGG